MKRGWDVAQYEGLGLNSQYCIKKERKKTGPHNKSTLLPCAVKMEMQAAHWNLKAELRTRHQGGSKGGRPTELSAGLCLQGSDMVPGFSSLNEREALAGRVP